MSAPGNKLMAKANLKIKIDDNDEEDLDKVEDSEQKDKDLEDGSNLIEEGVAGQDSNDNILINVPKMNSIDANPEEKEIEVEN